MLIPSRLLVGLTLVPLLLALGVLFDRSMLWAMLTVDGVLLMVAAFDAVASRATPFAVERRAPTVVSVGRDVPITFVVRSRASIRHDLHLTMDLPDGVTAEELPRALSVGAASRAEFEIPVTATRRGATELGAVYLRWPSRLRLWLRQTRFDLRSSIRVYPDVQAVRDYETLVRKNQQWALARATRRVGGETEFEQLREFGRDDSFRSIDWRATARRGVLVARQYRQETDQSVVFLLDAGRLMSARVGELSLFDHALNAMLMLAHVAVHAGDKAGLVAYGDRILASVPPIGGSAAVQTLIRACYDVHPELVEAEHRLAFEHLQKRMRRRALVVVFTQIVDDRAATELLGLVRSVSTRHLPLIIPIRDVDVDALAIYDTQTPQDLYVRAAAAQVLTWREGVLRQLSNAGALVLETTAREMTPRLIDRYLEVKARQQL